MFLPIGPYTLETLSNGQVRCHSIHGAILVPLERFLYDQWQEHRFHVATCKAILEAYENLTVDQLLDDPRIPELLQHMPPADPENLPGLLPPDQCHQWHQQQFITAYNKLHHTNLTLQEVVQ